MALSSILVEYVKGIRLNPRTSRVRRPLYAVTKLVRRRAHCVSASTVTSLTCVRYVIIVATTVSSTLARYAQDVNMEYFIEPVRYVMTAATVNLRDTV